MIIDTTDSFSSTLLESIQAVFTEARFEPSYEFNVSLEKSDNFIDILKSTGLRLDDPLFMNSIVNFNAISVNTYIFKNDDIVEDASVSFQLDFFIQNDKKSLIFDFSFIDGECTLEITMEKYWNIRYRPFENILLYKDEEISFNDHNFIYYLLFTEVIVDTLLANEIPLKEMKRGKLFDMYNRDKNCITNILTLKKIIEI